MVDGWLGTSSGRWLSDFEASQLLACYGVNVVEFRSATTEDEAVQAAEELGVPGRGEGDGGAVGGTGRTLGASASIWSGPIRSAGPTATSPPRPVNRYSTCSGWPRRESAVWWASRTTRRSARSSRSGSPA